MGVKSEISKVEIREFFKVKDLKKTKNGVRDTVYILDNRYILKVFENSDEKNIQNEIDILNASKGLKVPKIVKPLFYINGKPALYIKSVMVKALKKETGCLETDRGFF